MIEDVSFSSCIKKNYKNIMLIKYFTYICAKFAHVLFPDLRIFHRQ